MPTPIDPRRLRAIVGGSAGNLVEWYDWFAYAGLAIYFAPRFFPAGDPTAQLLSAAAIFAVGFLILAIAQLGFLGDTEEQGDWINGLHGFLALIILIAGLLYAQKAWRELRPTASPPPRRSRLTISCSRTRRCDRSTRT